MAYVDGYVLPVPEENLNAYIAMAKIAADVWMEHGAIEYRECVSDDMKSEFGVSFPDNLQLKPGEIVVFAWIKFKSKDHRDEVNKKKAMNDSRLKDMNGAEMPFDCGRMVYGGFRTMVEG